MFIASVRERDSQIRFKLLMYQENAGEDLVARLRLEGRPKYVDI
jgi:hypothetical protein